MANRKISVEIVGDSRGLERTFKKAGDSARNFNISIRTLIKSAVVFRAVREGLDAIGSAVRGSISEFSEQQKVAAQTNAALKSTAGIANVTAKRVDKLATSIQRYSGIDDEAIKAGENLLLTFKNVRNEAGKGNKVFDRATKAAVDLSVAGFGSLDSTAKQLGKALNDPIKGMTALGRAGVTFSQGQKDTIKQLVETGRTLDAQKLILKEVTSQVGGSARAFGETIPGALARTSEAFKNMGGAIVGAVAPAVADVAQLIADALPKIERSVSDFVSRLKTAGSFSAKIDVVIETVGDLAAQLTKTVGNAVRSVDWDAVWAEARGIGDGLQARLEQVDFGFIGKEIGDALTQAVRVAIPAAKELAERINNAVRAIDFEELGKQLGPGLAAAVVTAFVTLSDPAFWIRNWDLALAVAAAVFRARILTVAAKIAAPFARIGTQMVGALFTVINRELPKIGPVIVGILARIPRLVARAFSPLTNLVKRVFGNLGKLAQFVVRVLGLQVAINAVVEFAKRVGKVFSDLGNAIDNALQRAWDTITRQAIRAALAIIDPFSRLPGVFGEKFRDAKEAMQQQLAGMAASAKDTAHAIQSSIDGIQGKEVTVTVTTKFATATRPQGPDIPNFDAGPGPVSGASKKAAVAAKAAAAAAKAAAEQVAAAERAAAEATAKARKAAAAAAKRAAAVAAKAAVQVRTAFEALLDSLDLNLDKAAATATFRDDLVVLRKMETAIKAQIKEEGKTIDLQRKLFEIRQQRADLLRQQKNAKQFEALGLTDTGEKHIASIGAIRNRASNLIDQLKQSGLDPAKIRAAVKRISAVFTKQFDGAGRDIRSAILTMFGEIAGALNDGAGALKGPLTKTSGLNTKKLVEGLGLTPQQIRELRRRHAGFNTAGLAIAGGAQPTGSFVGGGPIVVENHLTVEIDGQKVGSVVTKQQQKDKRRNPRQKRGPNRNR